MRYSDLFRGLIFTLFKLLNAKPLLFLIPLVNSRFYYGLDFLSKLNGDDKVIICDGRDLIFQVSPQKVYDDFILNKDVVIVANEDDTNIKNGVACNLESSPLNIKWISLINPKLANQKELIKNSIINGGFIMGEVSKLREILKKTILIMEYSSNILIEQLDQAALNILKYLVAPDALKVERNGEIVFNMCSRREDKEISNDKNSGKLYIDGKIIPVVHMFDRHGTYQNYNLNVSIDKF